MKILMLVLLTLGHSAFAAEDGADDELYQALRNLNTRGLVVDRSSRQMAETNGRLVAEVSAITGGIIGFMNLPAFERIPHWIEPIVLKTSAVTFAGGALIYAGAYALRYVRQNPVPGPASQYVDSADGMNEFFKLTLEQQFNVASQDPNLRTFIVTQSHAYDYTDRRLPDAPIEPEDKSAPAPEPTPAP